MPRTPRNSATARKLAAARLKGLQTTGEVARAHGLALATVRKRAKKLKLRQVAGRYLFSTRDVTRLVDDLRQPGKRGPKTAVVVETAP